MSILTIYIGKLYIVLLKSHQNYRFGTALISTKYLVFSWHRYGIITFM